MIVDGKNETHYTRVKFGATGTTQRQRQGEWLQQWWDDFGLNKTAMDPLFFQRDFQYECDTCVF